jgi:hypothetical protein
MSQLIVITRVPTQDEQERGGGNLAVPPGLLWMRDPTTDKRTLMNPVAVLLTIQTDVFHLGEIIVVDGDGREIGGMGRKPSKWSVETERFGDLDAAIACSRRVMDRS